MTEIATTPATANPRPDRRFAGGLPWEPSPSPGAFAGSAPIVLPERAKPKPVPTAAELEELGRRTASVAHDFNNLLSVIMVCAGEIADGATGVHGERAEEIREAAQRGADLCRGLLGEERAVGRDIPPRAPGPLAVEEAILASLKLIERALGPAIRVDLASEGALPRVALAAADLERVLLNLAANSRDAMPGGGAVAIRTATVPVPPGDPCLGTGLHVRITFGDSGSGMSPEVAHRALEPYFTTKDGEAGSGLGLAGAHAMVRNAGGDLRINSRPGIGTLISVYLPALDAAGEPLALRPGS
ncbi:MAG: ATP-binding protein [Solirubrobacterales bacterium]